MTSPPEPHHHALGAAPPNFHQLRDTTEPRYDELCRQILDRFAGRVATVAEIEEFVLVKTAFRETHYKKKVLRALELAKPARIAVLNALANRRPGTFADSRLQIQFL